LIITGWQIYVSLQTKLLEKLITLVTYFSVVEQLIIYILL
jgi:hypothetical protein